MSSTRYCIGVFGLVAMHGVFYAATGAIDGAIGAKVMQDAGYEGYHVLQSVRMGAAGGAVVGAAVGLTKELLHALDQKFEFLPRDPNLRAIKHYQQTVELGVGEIILSIASMAASGALGFKMLMHFMTMSLQQAVIALTVGSSIMCAASLALVACCYCCVVCCVGALAKQPTTPDYDMGTFRKASLGSIFASMSQAPAPAPVRQPVVELPAYSP